MNPARAPFANILVPSAHPGGINIPLACEGALPEEWQILYPMFGIQTVTLMANDDKRYIVPSARVGEANIFIRDGGDPHSVQALRQVYIKKPSVPHWQPRVTPLQRLIYQTLGVDTFDIEVGGAAYTILASHWNPDSTPSQVTNDAPLAEIAVNHIRLREAYIGAPDKTVELVAKAFGIRFVRCKRSGDDHTTYWVPIVPGTLEATLERLGMTQ